MGSSPATAVFQVRVSTLLSPANSQSKCNSARKKGGDLEYFALLQTTKNEEGLVKYHQITSGERYRISALRQEGYCPASIARRIGRHRSSISRELRRNGSPWDGRYRPSKAQEQPTGRRSRSRRNQRCADLEWEQVKSALRERWSPEQASGYLWKSAGLSISHETIYRYVWNDRS